MGCGRICKGEGGGDGKGAGTWSGRIGEPETGKGGRVVGVVTTDAAGELGTGGSGKGAGLWTRQGGEPDAIDAGTVVGVVTGVSGPVRKDGEGKGAGLVAGRGPDTSRVTFARRSARSKKRAVPDGAERVRWMEATKSDASRAELSGFCGVSRGIAVGPRATLRAVLVERCDVLVTVLITSDVSWSAVVFRFSDALHGVSVNESDVIWRTVS